VFFVLKEEVGHLQDPLPQRRRPEGFVLALENLKQIIESKLAAMVQSVAKRGRPPENGDKAASDPGKKLSMEMIGRCVISIIILYS
jgi:hypothetical protein